MGGIIQGVVCCIGGYILTTLAKKYSQKCIVKWLIGLVLALFVVTAVFIAGEYTGVIQTKKLTGEWTVTGTIEEFWKKGAYEIDEILNKITSKRDDNDVTKPDRGNTKFVIPPGIPTDLRVRIDEIMTAVSGLEASRRQIENSKEARQKYREALEDALSPIQIKLSTFNDSIRQGKESPKFGEGRTYAVEEMKEQIPKLEEEKRKLEDRINKVDNQLNKYDTLLATNKTKIESLNNAIQEAIDKYFEEREAFDVNSFLEALKLSETLDVVRDVDKLYESRKANLEAILTAPNDEETAWSGASDKVIETTSTGEGNGVSSTNEIVDATIKISTTSLIADEANDEDPFVEGVQKVFTIEMPPEVVDDPDESDTPDFKL